MATIYKVDCPNRKPLFEGVQGENEARSIQFDITAWVEELGAGAVTATAKRPTDAQPYPVTIEQGDGNIVTWKPTSTDTAFEGVGSFQLEYTVDDVLAKTCIWSTQIAPSLDPAGDPPEPYDNWLASMREVAAAAQQSANDSAASAQQAAGEVTNAQTEVKNAEAWAVGTKGGVDVPSTDETYHNNAKYWAGQAENLKDGTQTIVDEARADVFEAMDGMHEETTAGSALQLISDKYTEDKVPYLFRKSGGGKSIGNREIDTLVGGSVAFNQLVQTNSTGTYWGSANATKTFSDGVVTFTATEKKGYVYIVWNYTPNHVYFFNVDVKTTTATTSVQTNWYGGNPRASTIATTNWQKLMSIGKASSGSGGAIRLCVSDLRDSGWDAVQAKNPMIFDLTAMFGTAVADRLYAMEQANAGSGVAWFKERFPKDYYAYNDGSGRPLSVVTSAHEMVGFNQWDGTSYRNQYWNDSGVLTNLNDNSCTDKILVIPNEDYYFSNDANITVKFFNGSMTLLRKENLYTNASNRVLKAPIGSVYCCVNFSGANAPSGFRFNISNPDRNGEYEPYQKHTYQIDPIELMGTWKVDANGEIYTDGDRYPSSGKVDRRYGIVDLGTITPSASSSVTNGWAFAVADMAKWPNNDHATPNGMVAGYVAIPSKNSNFDGSKQWTYRMNTQNAGILIADPAWSGMTAAQVKTAMSGVYLIYEKATPTTETADPFVSPQIVDAYGTERYVDEREVAVPVGHDTEYPEDLVAKLDGLPWDFSSLIAPTEKAYTATRNYTAGSLLIVGNILYKVTANIANGGAITPNTNVTATTLSEVISAL